MSEELSKQQLGRNRRQSLRRPPKGQTKVVCRKGNMDLGNDLSLGVLNLSQTGARLVLQCELPKGQEVTLTLDSLNHPRQVRLLGNVVWCQLKAEQWQVGIRFQKRLNYRSLIDLA